MRLTLRGCANVCGVVGAVVGLVLLAFGGCRGQYSGGDTTGLGGSGNNDFLSTGRTLSFFSAHQVDPRSEDSAGPQFVVAEDLDHDGLLDLVSAWNQSQPVQIHLQRRNDAGQIRFQTTTLAGNIPVVSVAGLAVADFDTDGRSDIAVLLKQTFLANAGCLNSEAPTDAESSGLVLLYMGPTDATQVDQALAWREVAIEASRLAGTVGDGQSPDVGGFTSMTIGDVDNDDDFDVLVAWNSSCGEAGSTDAVIFNNQGPAAVRDGTWTFTVIPNSAPAGTAIKDVALGDMDADGDLDVVATFPDAGSMNVRWFRNPTVDLPDAYHIADGTWQAGTVGQIATQADAVRVGDIDGDGRLDVVVRSSGGRLIQWLKGPGSEATTTPLPQIPWQVYTLAEFSERTPRAMAIGDLNSNDQAEVIVSAGGGLLWLDSAPAPTVYDQWTSRLIIDDEPPGTPGAAPATTDPNVSPVQVAGTTVINSILVVDLDGDGAKDLVATLDRAGLSGLSNDALVWFRSTLHGGN